MVIGCGALTGGVTHVVTGFVPCCDLSARGCWSRPGPGSSRAHDAAGGRELEKAILAIIRSWRPDLLDEFGVGLIVAAAVLVS